MATADLNGTARYYQVLSLMTGNQRHRDIANYYKLKTLVQDAIKLYCSEYIVLGPDLRHLEAEYISQIKDCLRVIGDEFEPNIKGLPGLTVAEIDYLKSKIDTQEDFLFNYDIVSQSICK